MADNRPLFDDEQLPDWLTSAGITHAAQSAQSAQPTQPPSSPSTPDGTPAVKPIKKLGSKPLTPPLAAVEAPPEADPNLTYEEWEQRQIAQEQAAQRTPEDDLLDAVPDWLSADQGSAPPEDWQPSSTGDTGGLAGGVEFMPAWFAGLDEQSPEDAPDWFKPDEIASTSLSGPMTVKSTAATASENPSGPPAALPDWMRADVNVSGGAGEDGGMDFNALFGDPDSVVAGAPEPEIGGTPIGDTSLTDALALDWMSDLPDLPDFSSDEMPLRDPSFDQTKESLGESYDAFSSFEFPIESPTMNKPDSQADDDMPDWMREMAADEPPTASSSTSLRSVPQQSARIEPEADSGTLPDWLRGLSGSDSISQPSSAPLPPAKPTQAELAAATDQSADFQDWMMDASPSAPARKASDDRGTPNRSSSQMAAADLDLSGNISSDDLDTLLNSLPTSDMPDSDPFAAPPRMDFGSISLDESDLDQILGPMPTAPAETPVVAPVPSTPSASVPRHGGRGPQAQPAADGSIDRGQIPDSVLEQISSDEPVQFSIGPVQIAVQETSLSELSDQLRQLRDRAIAFKPPPPSPTATAGPLADIAGTLAIEPIVVQAAATPSQLISSGAMTTAQRQRVDLIRHILEMDIVEPPESALAPGATPTTKPTAAPRPAIRIKIDRLVVTLLLLVALVAPFFTNVFNVVAPPDASSPTAEQSAVYTAIDSITSGHLVLMAFEYGPTGANEMDDLARVMLRDLFKHGAKPVIVSTNFAGAMHADALLNSFGHDANELKALGRTADKPLVARQDYVILRYLPSGAAGVRSVVNAIYVGGFDSQTEFTLDVEGQPSGLTLATDLPLLKSSPAIVLAETPEDVRNWAEQYRTPAGLVAGTTEAKIVLGVSAAAAATARTYSTALSKTVIGPLIGLRDATLYQLARQPPATSTDLNRLNQRWQSVGLGALVAAMLILFGALFSLVGSLRRQRAGRRQQAQAGGRR